MADLQFTVLFSRGGARSRSLVLSLFALICLLPSHPLAAEATPGLPAVDLPKELGSSGWTARDNARVLAADQFAIIQDGEIFLEYGLGS